MGKKADADIPICKAHSRLKIYLRNELIAYHAIKGNRVANWLVKMACLNYLNSTVTDESLRQKLLPDYPIGAKRILVADGYYEALIRDNVELITDPIDAVDETGILTEAAGIIRATSLFSAPGLSPIHSLTALASGAGRESALRSLVSRRQGLSRYHHQRVSESVLHVWAQYNLGHNSILLMAETQADYIIQALDCADVTMHAALEVREDIEAVQHRSTGAAAGHGVE